MVVDRNAKPQQHQSAAVREPVTVVSVTHTRLLGELIATRLASDPRIVIAATLHEPRAALRRLSTSRCDLALLDPTIPGAAELVAAIRAATAVRVLCLSTPDRESDILDLVRSGVAGFAPSDCAIEQLPEIMLAAFHGQFPCDKVVAQVMADYIAEHGSIPKSPNGACRALTERERQILGCIERGLPNKLIAHDLFISISTVKSHVHNLLEKLSATNRVEAVVRAKENGLI